MAIIRTMWMRLPELQNNDVEIREIQSKGPLKRWEDIERVFHY